MTTKQNIFLVCFLLTTYASSVAVASDAEDLAEAMKEMKELKKQLEILQAEEITRETTGEIGASYIRWGRQTCVLPGTLVYRGYIAGSLDSSTGGGSNQLCLPHNPEFNYNVAGTTGYSVMYGVEYEVTEANYVFSKNNSNGISVGNYTAPCAVCFIQNKTTVLTIPARVSCPIGWTREYQGYIMAAYSAATGHYRTEYICVDEAPEAADGGVNQNQGKLYLVEMGCGSLPCSVYVAGTELNCVVCSR